MAEISQIIKAIEDFAPLEKMSEWDNSGWQVKLESNKTDKILLSLNLDEDAVNQAVNLGCDLIISHHPYIFSPLKKIDDPVLTKTIQNNIQIYSAHTNLDSARGGTTDMLAEKVGFSDCAELNEFVRYKFLDAPADLNEFLTSLKTYFDIKNYRLVNKSAKYEFSSIAFCAGSGGGFIREILAAGIDLYITSDVKYHDALDAENLIVIDIGHFESEKYVKEIFKNILQDKNVELFIADEKNIWQTL